MVESHDEAIVLCTACGRRQTGSPHLCEYCGAPLTAHAGTDPVLGIMSRGFAAYQATRNPGKRIVVIGMWLWLAPVIFLALTMASMSLGVTISGIHDGRWLDVFGGTLGFIATSAIALIQFAILVRTTETYFRQKTQLGEKPAESSEDGADEPIKCLACGQTMSQETNVCGLCGWSFSDRD